MRLVRQLGGQHRLDKAYFYLSGHNGVDQKRCFVSGMKQLRLQYQREFENLPEYRAMQQLNSFLEERAALEIVRGLRRNRPTSADFLQSAEDQGILSQSQHMTCLTAALATFYLYVESRRASLCGVGYYTIGPCGEEALAGAALALQPHDSVALHYRHLSINITRQLLQSNFSELNKHKDEPGNNDRLTQLLMQRLQDISLQRARGYTVRRTDPVTGGVHCAIGDGSGSGDDYIVTSTLASQCCPAVGRALGFALRRRIQSNLHDSGNTDERHHRLWQRGNDSPISFVTLGDGSVHNAHFWSAFHLARHARHRNIKCPVVFGISDNGLSISYKTMGYVRTIFENDPLVPLFEANGNDVLSVYRATSLATEHSRRHGSPAVVLYKGLIRRFGHAATDRQSAYLESQEIQSMAEASLMERLVEQSVEICGVTSYSEVLFLWNNIKEMVQISFDQAVSEEGVTRKDMLERTSAPLVPTTCFPLSMQAVQLNPCQDAASGKPSECKPQVMRKLMNRVIVEVMHDHQDVVYLGEDCRHGGYYVVTEGIKNTFDDRIIDFPPDETSLLGAAVGFAQVGLTPIVEIPYAKYLDCGADMFYEIAVMHWLSAGQRPNGMIIRLQGFDRGLFGGNFHTHNMLQHVPPGIDTLCFSNGEDYVRGFRNAIVQAKAGRVIMLVDCTDLMNRRHLHGTDKLWERVYPKKESDCSVMGFNEIRRYGTCGFLGIVTYGNGVVTALQARKALVERKLLLRESDLDIIDCPYLSDVPLGLKNIAASYDGLLFADICKAGPGSCVLSNTVTALQSDGKLPPAWTLVAAPRTYNPLGSMVTFLNVEDILTGIQTLQNITATRLERDSDDG